MKTEMLNFGILNLFATPLLNVLLREGFQAELLLLC